ncbi:MAG: nucleotidyltransferase family protein [Candidatus Berkelbacteria bacterium]|nr:nucleotidyltransferase family protein [Candidatus Berkelbacteria bacterium]
MTRVKLCITLKSDVLKKIDNVIDGLKLRNRSHAIEYLLSQSLPSKISKAFILAAGKGIKMRPFTYEMPKAMLLVKGKPILEHTLETLKNNGIQEAIILVGPKGEKIKEYFGDGSCFGIKISYIDEEKPSGTATPLKKAKTVLGSDPFLLIYGDVLAKINIREMIDFHEENQSMMTMAITSVNEPGDWGVVNLRGNKIISFVEKPKKPGLSHLVNAGIFVLEPEIFKYIPEKKFSRLENDVFPQLVQKNKITGYLFEGKWFDVGTPENYEKTIKEWGR